MNYKSYNQNQPISYDAALFEEFSSIAACQNLTSFIVQDEYINNPFSDTAREITRNLEARKL